MNGARALFAGDAVPGWFGKLHGMSGFAHQRLPDDFCADWGRWLQAGFVRLRARHGDRHVQGLRAPLWCFVLGDAVVGAPCWLGVLWVSVDAAGRLCPLSLAAELLSPPAELHGDALACVQRWWMQAARAAREGLEQDLDVPQFDALLQRLFAEEGRVPAAAEPGAALALPVFGQSLWFTDPAAEGGLGMASQGLPQDEQFEALFGLAAGAAAQEPEAP